MYVRDVPTADMLNNFGISSVFALGNPMLDDLNNNVLDIDLSSPIIALLPGSRSYAVELTTNNGESHLNIFLKLQESLLGQEKKLPIIKGWQYSSDKSLNISIYRQPRSVCLSFKTIFCCSK